MYRHFVISIKIFEKVSRTFLYQLYTIFGQLRQKVSASYFIVSHAITSAPFSTTSMTLIGTKRCKPCMFVYRHKRGWWWGDRKNWSFTSDQTNIVFGLLEGWVTHSWCCLGWLDSWFDFGWLDSKVHHLLMQSSVVLLWISSLESMCHHLLLWIWD